MIFDASTAVQSTTQMPGRDDADHACDGVTNTVHSTPPHCAHTGRFTDNWWQVELAPAGNVTAVDIYFRSECCGTFIIIILHGNLYFTEIIEHLHIPTSLSVYVTLV